MRVLSLDVDFFVTPVARSLSLSDEARLPGSRYKTPTIKVVRQFLEERCKLSAQATLPGVFMRHHGQAFDVIDRLANRAPIELIHVDAHADLGLGWGKAGESWKYILRDWIHRPAPRPNPTDHVDAGNWLAFAAAGECLQTVQFVPTEKPTDLFRYYFRRDEQESPYGRLTLEFFALTDADFDKRWFDSRWPAVVDGRTPVVSIPFDVVAPEHFRLPAPPDFVMVCQSPQFTPKSADEIIELAREYVHEADIGVDLTPPL